MVLASLQKLYFAEEAQHQLSFLAHQRWEQRLNNKTLLTMLQGSLARAPEILESNGLLGEKSKEQEQSWWHG